MKEYGIKIACEAHHIFPIFLFRALKSRCRYTCEVFCFSSGVPPLVVSVYSIVAVCMAYVIAWLKRDGAQAPFYCGRKVSFTVYFSSYVYCADVTGFMLALVLNLLTLCKLANLYAKRMNRYEVQRQLKRIRYMIVISLVSTLFVALPNGISLISAWVGRVSERASESITPVQLVNMSSSI